MMCSCGARLPKGTEECPDCGHIFRRAGSGPSATAAPEFPECPCGALLTQEKRCSKTGLWPRMLIRRDPRGDLVSATFSCPYVCPICRGGLDWDGGCQRCYGCTTGNREDWTFPGDRYQREGAHWVLEAKGPRPACTPEENKRGMAEVLAILSKSNMKKDVR